MRRAPSSVSEEGRTFYFMTLLSPVDSRLRWGQGAPGGEDWPSSLLPQQAMEPSLITPQVWTPSALTGANPLSGGVDRLTEPLLGGRSFLPASLLFAIYYYGSAFENFRRTCSFPAPRCSTAPEQSPSTSNGASSIPSRWRF